MYKRIIAILLYTIYIVVFCGCSIISEENETIQKTKNVIENLAVEEFLVDRGILSKANNNYDIIESFLLAVENKDKNAIKEAFAPKAISEMSEEEFEKMIEEFSAYYSGTLVSVTELFGAVIDEVRNNGNESKEICAPFEVITSTNEYGLAARIMLRDDWNKDNIGIWSIYIIDKERDIDTEQPYRGDLEYRTGIYVDVARPQR